MFAHWFKDFAPFQSEDTYVTEIGDIPTSVKLVPLAELTKVITKGTTPTTLGFEYKKSGIPALKGAFAEESFFVGAENLEQLASIKSKNELIADVVALLQSPAKNVISALQASAGGKIHGLLQTLEER